MERRIPGIEIPYLKHKHPGNTSPDKFMEGGNCQLTVQGIISAMGFEMPDYYRSREIGKDMDFTEPVVDLFTVKTGDIFGFSQQTKTDLKWAHMGIAYKIGEEIMIIHNSKKVGKVSIVPLAEMISQDEYRKIAFIKRPVRKSEQLYNPEVLEQLGFITRQNSE